jgi:poly(3-hydroxyalkanoate) depolymerase
MPSAAQRRRALMLASESTIGEECLVNAGGQRIRVNVRHGTGVPLVLCNGIGASLEVLDPLVEQLNPASTVVRFDVPGSGGSPTSLLPYGFPYLAWVLGRVLSKLGIGVVDVLGLSWGGALAQQFAFQNPRRCRRLVLVATGTGALMVPAHPRILAKMVTPRRFSDPDYAATIAGELYGGTVRAHGEDVAQLFVRQLYAGSKIGYVHQLLAGAVWTSLFGLPAVRQQTLIVAGTDDPIIPVINAHIMNALLPHSRLYLHSGGHIDLVHNATELAPVIDNFLREPGEGP